MERRQPLVVTSRSGPRPTVPLTSPDFQMDRKKGSPSRKRNIFKGSVLVSLLVESHPEKFPTRLAASRLARRLYKDGHIRSIFGASEFEDSAQLYVWNDGNDLRKRTDGGHLDGHTAMPAPVTSSVSTPALPSSRSEAKAYDQKQKEPAVDWQLVQDIKSKVLNRSETYNIVTSYNTFFQELERDFGFDHNTAHALGGGLSDRSRATPYTSTLELKKQSSAHKSVDTPIVVSGQAEKDAVLKTKTEPAKGDIKSTHSPHRLENWRKGEVSASRETVLSSHISEKQYHSKHNVIESTRSVIKDQKTSRRESRTTAHTLSEANSVKTSAQRQDPRDTSSTPSKASSFSPPSALVKPHQHHNYHKYHHHQYQNQLDNIPVNSHSPPSQASHQSPKKSVHKSRDPKESAVMDANVTANLFDSKTYAKNLNYASPGSHTQQQYSQPSTLESGIGSSHPDSTANSSSVPPNHQSFSLGTLETSDSRHHQYGHYPQTQPHGHQRYTKENSFSPQESQHQSHSLSPPEIPKYPDTMSFRRDCEEQNAFKRDGSPGNSKRPGPPSGEKSHGLKDLGITAGAGGFETPDVAEPNSTSTRFHNDIGGGSMCETNPAVVSTVSGSGEAVGGIEEARRWASEAGVVIDSNNSYSDNEKQLLEEMRRMKQEHQSVLRTYEGRVNKLMAKMHELRNIAEMLENSSSKPLPGKLTLLDILEDKDMHESRLPPAVSDGETVQPTLAFIAGAANVDNQHGQNIVPPPLPPRPSRGTRVYPNKPIIHTSALMQPLLWTRIILNDEGVETPGSTVWHGMQEPVLDTEELERLFSNGHDQPSDVNLYDDVCLRRGRAKTQLVSIYENERSQRIVSELRALPCTLPDVIQAFVTLNSSDLHTDSFAELLELLTSARELDKILHHVKRKGAGQLEAPEYLVYELSKVDHFRERLEFLRFKNKLQINLFEIDQQLKELNTACEEIMSNLSLKNVLETVLAVGNHMNAGTDRGQADGFRVDVLNSLKDIQDTLKRGNLLELILRVYCLKYESAVDLGCPTRFQLPEPSNMRHAAQVSFEDIQRALKELKDELAYVRGKLEALSVKEGNTVTIALRVTSENFMTSAMEVLAEEQKLLETTRIHFWKTASYFSQDGQKSSPREFFQVWASFLHDCKYYWKLAHRNLARDKFNADLATTSQLSSSSLPGFNSLKSTMMRHVASFSQDDEMRENRARQLEHINSWIESVGRYTLEMGPEDHEENYFNENDYPQQQHSYHYQLQQNHIHHQSHHDELAGDAFDSPENADDRDCPTPVNLPDNNWLVRSVDMQVQIDQGNVEDDEFSSPYYKNQPRIMKIFSSSSKLELQQKKSQHQGSGFTQPHKSHQICMEADFDQNQVQTSPKPIKAIPPNVIKPQPITQASPTVSSPSPTYPHHHTIHLAKPMPRVDTNNNTHNSAKKHNMCNSSNKASLSGSNRVNNDTLHPSCNGNLERDSYTDANNFGFEPLYESLSRHTFNQPASPPSDGSETPPPYTESENEQMLYSPPTETQDYNGNNDILSPGAIEPENPHKKNGNFFKSLMKRDSKHRTPSGSGDQQQQNSNHQQNGNQHSALRSVSAPFNKLRNTVVQKLSGSSNSKKSNTNNVKPSSSYENPNNNGKHKDAVKENPDSVEESPPKPPRGFLIDHNYESQTEGKTVNNSINPFHDDVVNYQNYFYPGQPPRADVAAGSDRDNRNQQDGGFEEYQSSGRPAAVMLVASGHRDGHDSLPSTVSSRHSGRDQGLSMYREANSQGLSYPYSKEKDRSRRPNHSKERHSKPSHHPYGSPDFHQNKVERPSHRGGPKARSGRDRAPIALGSNVSISDMYGKALEAAAQFSEDEEAGGIRNSESRRDEHMGELQSKGQHPEGQALVIKGDFDNSNGISMTAESKWVKATAVPVYKAKLIPNYENQTKYDPKLEGGIRGHAGPVTAPAPGSRARHVPQTSCSSDMYRQELQKKSGQYVVGGGSLIYQDPSNCSSLKSRNGNSSAMISSPSSSVYPGAPTSYTVLPPKFLTSHYHASPLVLSQHPSNSSQLHQPPILGKNSSENTTNDIPLRSPPTPPLHHHNEYKASDGDSANTDNNHIKAVAASMFTVSPDGRLELGPSRDVHSAEGSLSKNQKDQQSNRRVVARRSSSANNILDRTHGNSKTPSDGHGKRRYHADDNVCNSKHHQDSNDAYNERRLQGHASRRDDDSKKVTPTSSRQPAAPQSVMSLVDRFEQTPPPKSSSSSNYLHPPLMVDDKPPSMTSTPLARRKNVREEGIRVSPPGSSGRSDDASTHSHSTSSKKSYSHHHADQPNQQHRHATKSSENNDKTRSHKYYKNEEQVSRSHRKYDSGHKSNTKRSGSYPEMSLHQGKINLIQESPNPMPPSHQQNHPFETNPSSYSSHHQHRHQQSQNTDKKLNDGTQKFSQNQTPESSLIHGSVQRDRGKEIRASSQIASSNQGHGWGGQGRLDERLTYSSQSHQHGHYLSSPPESSSHLAGAVYHSPFLPKPEPQYPGQQKQQQQSKNSKTSSNNINHNSSSSHHHSSDRNIQLRHPHQMSQSLSSSNSINKAHNNNDININSPVSEFKSSKSNSHNVHRRPSPQILYISPQTGQQTNKNGSNSNNNNGDGNIISSTAINNNYEENTASAMQTESSGNDMYTAELRRAIKSSNSAFDRPLKSGPLYGRQPGAMAVVKPTVMHS